MNFALVERFKNTPNTTLIGLDPEEHSMEKLQCKACGSNGMVPMHVVNEDEEENDAVLGEEQESHFYTCQVCGDNWLTVKETAADDCQITFIHQMGMQPVLKRVARMQTPVLLQKSTVDHWDYYLDDELVEKEAWQSRLTDRRKILKSICSN